MNGLKPWAVGPFEMLYHAESHFQNGDDFDRRIALISFDNTIEVAITTYLALHPIQRAGIEYSRVEIEKWQRNYHTKLDFFYEELGRRTLPIKTEQADVVYYHQNRNDQYHGGSAGVPEKHKLEGIREAAIWVVEVLFDIADANQLLQAKLENEQRRTALPVQEDEKDRRIDAAYGMVEVAGVSYYASEILFHLDYQAYKEIAEELAVPEAEQAEGIEDAS